MSGEIDSTSPGSITRPASSLSIQRACSSSGVLQASAINRAHVSLRAACFPLLNIFCNCSHSTPVRTIQYFTMIAPQ